MMVLLVFEFREKLPAPRLADALHALRTAARKEMKALMWKGEHTEYSLVFLGRLERLCEAALNYGGWKDAPVAMDVNLPPKRQRRGDYTPTTLSSPVSSLPPATLRRTSTPQQSISTGRPSVKTQQATRSQPPSVPPNPPPQPCQLVCARLHHIPCTGTSFTTLESMLASFPYPLSHVNTDRLAVILAAKVAILNEGSRGRCRRSNTSTVAGRVEAVGAQGSSS
jgi:hypothetical protein